VRQKMLELLTELKLKMRLLVIVRCKSMYCYVMHKVEDLRILEQTQKNEVKLVRLRKERSQVLWKTMGKRY